MFCYVLLQSDEHGVITIYYDEVDLQSGRDHKTGVCGQAKLLSRQWRIIRFFPWQRADKSGARAWAKAGSIVSLLSVV